MSIWKKRQNGKDKNSKKEKMNRKTSPSKELGLQV
jgi:hypothetical protein